MMHSLKQGILLLCIAFILQGCASSGATRHAASEADKAYLQTDYAFNHPDASLRDTIQNTSQTTKGVVLGGITGALVGSMYSSSIGFLPGLAGGAIIGGAIGAYIDSYATLSDNLENRGVNVIVLGDQILIVIPSHLIFNPYSGTLRSQAYSTLDMIVQYINQFTNISVQVSGYSNPTDTGAVTGALSQQQADAVMRYLWKAGLNTRVLYAMGYGSYKPVSQDTDWSSDNNRIEITLEKLPV